ncbi:hypothetical protein BX666DRAFT_1970560 [Dichotomocladium elegans]|nr:hypothetical protein BX666DRAFT_1970560 [Dichotomocladium elegans]
MLLSVYPTSVMGLDYNFPQTVPAAFSRGDLLALSSASTTTSAGSGSTALCDTPTSSPFGLTVSSAGAMHSFTENSFPSFFPPQQLHAEHQYQQYQQQQQQQQQPLPFRTLASDSSVTQPSSCYSSPPSFDDPAITATIATMTMGPSPFSVTFPSPSAKMVSQQQQQQQQQDHFLPYEPQESGLPVDPCVFGTNNGYSNGFQQLASPVTVANTLSHHFHSAGYHPYLCPGKVLPKRHVFPNKEKEKRR